MPRVSAVERVIKRSFIKKHKQKPQKMRTMPLSMWYDQAITKNKHIRFEQFVAKASHSPMAEISDRFRCRFPPGERGLKYRLRLGGRVDGGRSPLRGAWIEMWYTPRTGHRHASRSPLRGAWTELFRRQPASTERIKRHGKSLRIWYNRTKCLSKTHRAGGDRREVWAF